MSVPTLHWIPDPGRSERIRGPSGPCLSFESLGANVTDRKYNRVVLRGLIVTSKDGGKTEVYGFRGV